MNVHENISYVESPARAIEAAKRIIAAVFSWSFVDYGPDYSVFSNEGIDGGFIKSDLSSSSENGAALIVFYSNDLDKIKSKIENAGDSIIKPIFSFPVGHRFHFDDPNRSEYAVWSYK